MTPYDETPLTIELPPVLAMPLSAAAPQSAFGWVALTASVTSWLLIANSWLVHWGARLNYKYVFALAGAAVVCGIIGVARSRTQGRRRGAAIAGIALGGAVFVTTALYIVVILAMLFTGHLQIG